MKKLRIIALGSLAAVVLSFLYCSWNSHLSLSDFLTFNASAEPVGRCGTDSLQRLGLKPEDLRSPSLPRRVTYKQKCHYLNNTRSVVSHTIDDSTKDVVKCLDAMDKYDIKATVFVSTQVEPISLLWPRLRQAIDNGHEIGSHSRRHQCRWPDTSFFCFRVYTNYEVMGSKEDILKNTQQPYVWSWCYPCGNCSNYEFVQRKLARAGYLVARNYPGERQDLHNLPDLQTYASNPYNAAYTQVVQRRGGIAKSGRTNVAQLNAKFDEVYQGGGIYNFLSHPQWLEYGEDKFYERHLAYVSKRSQVWYVPMGPLYAYQIVSERTEVHPLEPEAGKERFAIYNDLDPEIFTNSLTLEFSAPEVAIPFVNGKPIREGGPQVTDRWDREYFRRTGESVFVTLRPNVILEFR